MAARSDRAALMYLGGRPGGSRDPMALPQTNDPPVKPADDTPKSGAMARFIRAIRPQRGTEAEAYPPISVAHSSSVRTWTPSSRALASLEPAASPATT